MLSSCGFKAGLITAIFVAIASAGLAFRKAREFFVISLLAGLVAVNIYVFYRQTICVDAGIIGSRQLVDGKLRALISPETMLNIQ